MFFRLLDWVDRDSRHKKERIIVFKNMFNADDFEVCFVQNSYQVYLFLFPCLSNMFYRQFMLIARIACYAFLQAETLGSLESIDKPPVSKHPRDQA